ncbi:aminopeptidase P family protein [Candidatus Woesearchaeota archaeon]|nr:aminopeptidase P family protein [Candidatus Woesearchaeota archaeon]HIH37885.1 aminopeptidase P family protein [Candidatus Woesearchaeota archaeon]HIJ04012.1 aminopeptidase P family protein [Candidatus Woesearchaeota archaeon]
MRIKDFQVELRKKGVDIALFMNTSLYRMDPTLFYFTRLQLEYAFLVMPASGTPYLVVPGFEHERAKQSSSVKPVLSVPKGKKPLEIISKRSHAKTIGVHKAWLSLSESLAIRKHFGHVKLLDLTEDLTLLRQEKTAEEIRLIMHACTLTCRLYKEVYKKFSLFTSEKDIAKYLFLRTTELGCKPAFNPIVASGKHASLPHALPSDKPLEKGFLVIDYGVMYKGYCSDVTRTVFIGTPTQKEKDTYEQILRVQLHAIHSCTPGISCSTLDKQVRVELGSQNKYFTHSLGHGFGIHIHEQPNISSTSKDILTEGTVFTIEPGIYPKTFGIRIEDDLLMTHRGGKVLTPLPKKLRVFPHPR